ncbi:Uncharacterised protein [BD1-7 clade bacterium]|uniref:Uncharacterized protein n=1 Tax=BD1-7 clade bacterium TaxID=2029982 RepID=A0A5S9NPX1_9GAMM|nr:Uncharacterised protein [BD1-7 clade bacterium]
MAGSDWPRICLYTADVYFTPPLPAEIHADKG